MKALKRGLLFGIFAFTASANAFGFADMFGGSSSQYRTYQTGTYRQQGYKSYPKYPAYPNVPVQQISSEQEEFVISLIEDAALSDALSALVKQNHLILDRIPYSAEDDFPKRLYDFKEDKIKNEELLKEYNACLEKLLERDFPLYKIIKGQLTSSVLKAGLNLLSGNILQAAKSGIGAAQIKAVEAVVKNLENAKLTLFYKRGGCLCPSYSKIYNEAAYCSANITQCNKYYDVPIEKVVNRYWSQNNTDTKWVETEVPQSCMRPVKGFIYPSFKDAFYSLLPSQYVSNIKDLEEQITDLQQKLTDLKGEIKALENKKNPTAEDKNRLNTLKKEEEELSKRLDNLNNQRKKLYKEAINSVIYPIDEELREEKVKLAENLLYAIKYVKAVNNEVIGLGIVNLIKIGKDLYDAATNPQATLQGVVIVAAKYRVNPEELKMIIKGVITSIPNMFATFYYIQQQNDFIEPYEKYLEAYINGARKVK